MTAKPAQFTSLRVTSFATRALARASVLGALLCVLLALPGCGLSVMGHRMDPFNRKAKPVASNQDAKPRHPKKAKPAPVAAQADAKTKKKKHAEPQAEPVAARADEKSHEKSHGRDAKQDEPKEDEPIRDAREQAVLAPKQPYWPYRVAQVYLDRDSIADAEAALKSSLAVDPTYGPSLSLLSKLYFQTGRHQQAIDMLEAARAQAETSPGGFSPALRVGLALHYDALGQPDQARSVLAALPSRNRDGAASVYLTLRGATPDSATDLANQALHDAPRSAVSQNNFGITRLRAGDPTAARRAFLAAIELDPRLPGPYYNLAILEKFYTLDDDEAMKWFKRYRDRASDDPDNLAQVFGTAAPAAIVGKGE